jgi:hypothetical protein
LARLLRDSRLGPYWWWNFRVLKEILSKWSLIKITNQRSSKIILVKLPFLKLLISVWLFERIEQKSF